jgi:hypothetical protein
VQDWPPPYGFARITTDTLAAGASIWNASWHTGEGEGAGYIETVPDVPNGNEGWGRVDLGTLFDPTAKRKYVDQKRVFTEPGERRVFSVKPSDPVKPLKVTPAIPAGPASRRDRLL